jgi:molecular chaperone DnaK
MGELQERITSTKDGSITAETLVYSAEKSVREYGEKIPADMKDDITKKIEVLKKLLPGDDVASMRSATSELSTAVSKIGEHMAKQAGPTEPAPETPTSGGEGFEGNSEKA